MVPASESLVSPSVIVPAGAESPQEAAFDWGDAHGHTVFASYEYLSPTRKNPKQTYRQFASFADHEAFFHAYGEWRARKEEMEERGLDATPGCFCEIARDGRVKLAVDVEWKATCADPEKAQANQRLAQVRATIERALHTRTQISIPGAPNRARTDQGQGISASYWRSAPGTAPLDPHPHEAQIQLTKRGVLLQRA